MSSYNVQDASSVAALSAAAAGVTENKACPGCQQSVMDENGGVVIAFGQSFFHVDCFKCAKCHNKVTADTNLLLLSDGQPVCSNCSYSCSVCHQPILDEAIMTGDDSYHAHCFKCRACHNRIDELMFAKTSHGIYCMNCHHQRVARSRRHAQKQKERDRSIGVGGSGSAKSKENGTRPPYSAGTSATRPSTAQSSTPSRDVPPLAIPSRSNTLPMSDSHPSSPATTHRRQSITSLNDNGQAPLQSHPSNGRSTPSSAMSPTLAPPDINGLEAYLSQGRRPSLSFVTASPNEYSTSQNASAASPPINSDLLSPSSESSDHSLRKRQSFDGRSLNIPTSNGSVAALNIPGKTSRVAKRGSILPGTAFDTNGVSSSTSAGNTSPIRESSNSPPYSSSARNGRSSPYRSPSPSPLKAEFSAESTRPPPMEHASSNTSSKDKDLRIESPHLRTRAESSSTYLPEHPKPQDSLGPGRPPLRPSVTLDRVPPRPFALSSAAASSESLRAPSPAGSIRPQRSFDDRLAARPLNVRGASPTNLSIDVEKSRNGYSSALGSGRSRPTSPAHRVDVPHGIESGTDDSKESEDEKSNDQHGVEDSEDDKPPSLPEKEPKYRPRPEQLKLQSNGNKVSSSSSSSQENDSAPTSTVTTRGRENSLVDDSDESSPVERVSHSTYIAPALPPIRFSMGPGDFSEFLTTVSNSKDHRGSLKSLDQLAKLSQDTIAQLDAISSASASPPVTDTPLTTPPPTAASTGADSTMTWRPIATPTSTSEGTISSRFSDSSSATTTIDGTSTVPTSLQSHDDMSTKSTAADGRTPRAGAGPVSRQNSLGSRSVDKLRLQQKNGTSQHGRSLSSELASHGQSASALTLIPRPRFDSNASAVDVSYQSGAQITVTAPGGGVLRPVKYGAGAGDAAVGGSAASAGTGNDLVTRRLQEALNDAAKRGATHVNLDKEFVQAIVMAVEQRRTENVEMKGRLDGMKRASKQYMDGLTVAQEEYDKELSARREAEAEVTRLRILLSGQAARITAMSSESRKGEVQKQLERELTDNLSGLEKDISKLKVERDVTLAEVEELASSRSSPNLTVDEASTSRMGRSFSIRLDTIKSQYSRELVPLTEEREALLREIAELKSARDVFLEETTMLNARNEELAQLNALYARRTEAAPIDNHMVDVPPIILERMEKRSGSFDRQRTNTNGTVNGNGGISASNTVLTTSSSYGGSEDSADKFVKVQKNELPAGGGGGNGAPAGTNAENAQTLRGKFKWMGGGGGGAGNRINKENIQVVVNPSPEPPKQSLNLIQGMDEGPPRGKHTFQSISVLRITRCDHCGDKLWGSLLRCTSCNVSVHPRCVHHFTTTCSLQAPTVNVAHDGPLPPSMFGRDLIEQVRADSRGDSRMVPIIVEKCIQAVELSAIDYEGIYRKTGGTGQSKIITQLFERGDYAAFDLHDTDKFNDICSITSVLKSYFRALPNPLLTYALHDEFMHASTTKDQMQKVEKYADLVKQLPTEHYYTLRLMMLHLHRIHERSEHNLMTARNLGVVFGPTLMRSRDPGAEFSDMAGKALSVECMVEYAPEIFPPLSL